jgi:uncharacterized phiE125 gp8 family phage protein
LTEAKLHLHLDSGSLADNLDSVQSIAPGSHGIHELLTLDVAPGGAGWAAGDTITGQTSTQTCTVVTKLTATTYYVKDRSGAFTLGEVLSNGVATADQGVAHPTFATGYYLIGAGVDVLNYQAVVELSSGTNGATGTLDVKIQESADNTTFTDWTGGAFTQITTDGAGATEPDNATYDLTYTGEKRYVRVVARVLLATCEFGVSVLRYQAITTEDTLLTRLIESARSQAEAETWRALITQTWDAYLDAWPTKNYIALPFPPLQSVTSVSWKDTDGTETTLTVTTDYIVETNGTGYGRIVLPYGGTWPSGTMYPSNPIKIRFICGYGLAAAVPSGIKAAMLLMISDLYENRGEVVVGAPVARITRAIDSLLSGYRMNRF